MGVYESLISKGKKIKRVVVGTLFFVNEEIVSFVLINPSTSLRIRETKNIHGLLFIFGIHESSISSLTIFTAKIIGQIFSIATPAEYQI